MKISKIVPTLFTLIVASCTPATSSSSFSISSSSDSLSSSENSTTSSSEVSSSSSISSSSLSSSSSVISSSLPSSSSSSSSSSIGEVVNFVSYEAPFYIPKERANAVIAKANGTLKYAIKNENTLIPYMSLKTALSKIYNSVQTEAEGNKITYKCPKDIEFTVDHIDNTITAHNFDMFIASYGGDTNIYHLTYDAEVDNYINEKSVTLEGTEDVVFALNKYNLDIYEYDDDFYIPFSVVNSITFNICYWASCNFNGNGFYLLDFSLGAVSTNYVGTSFEKDFHNGEYRIRNARSNYEFREYNYNSLMFNLDYFFGFRDDRISDFDEYLRENHPDIVNNLKSDNETFYCQAVEKLINYVVGDGHSSTGNNASACGDSTFPRAGYFSDRYIALFDNEEDLLARRDKAIGKNVPSLRYHNDTAIITFDQFTHYPYETTTSTVEALSRYDSFALVYSSLKKIEDKGGIKNIFIDLTCNPGGNVVAAIGILGFLTENVELTTYCALTKTSVSQTYLVDTNLDGSFDRDDCVADKYHFFILTSALSFSCATWFPHFAKENGCATIVGENTSGGACNSYITATPDGKIFRISGIAPRAGFKTDPSAHPDDGVKVDISLSRDYFYDNETLYHIAKTNS